MKFTKSMEKVIDKFKEYSLEHYKSVSGGSILLKEKPTKKKVFYARVFMIGTPMFQLLVGNKFKGNFIFNKETKEWDFFE
jgi:methylmalonyl-CoA mutase cobalamin-binding subunit